MPRASDDLSKVIIYCLESTDGLHKYVGSTTNLHRRSIHHKNRCHDQKSSRYNFKCYQIIRNNGGYSTFTYRILETRSFNNHKDKLRRESYYINLINGDMNTYKNYL
jgi:hypothetical protein